MTRKALTLAAVLGTALAAGPSVSAGAAPARDRPALHERATTYAGAGLDGFERAVIAGVNAARAQRGLAPVRANRALSRAADVHTRDMLRADFFDHPSSDGTSWERRVRRYADANMVGETLAYVRARGDGAAGVVQMWLDSPPHRAIVLEARFRRIGVARRWGTLATAPTGVVTADFSS
jgi:uncharacterized protein YkwD